MSADPASTGAVVDASVAVKWVVAEDGSEAAVRLLDGRALVAPELLLPECANILWKKAVRGELSHEEAALAGDLLARSDAELVGHRTLMGRALGLALDLGHPAYDCAYLALALERGLPLVTADRRLVRAVREDGRHAAHLIALEELAVQDWP